METTLYNNLIQKPCPSAQERFGKAFCLKHKREAKLYNDIRFSYMETIKNASIFVISDEIQVIIHNMVDKFRENKEFEEKVYKLARFPNSRFWLEWRFDKQDVNFGFLSCTNGNEGQWNSTIKTETANNMVLAWPIIVDHLNKEKENYFDYGVDYTYRCVSREKIELQKIILEARTIKVKNDVKKHSREYGHKIAENLDILNKNANEIKVFVLCFLAFLAEVPYESTLVKKDFNSEVIFKGANQPVDITTIVKIKSGAKRYKPNDLIERAFNKALEKIRKREHEVRSHWRHYRRTDGSIYHSVEVKSHKRGDPNLGRVFHSHYEVSVDNA